MQELPFLHSARRFMLIDICMKFHDATLYSLKVIERDAMETRFCEEELPFLHSACRLMLIDICMKFHDAILHGLKVIEWTRWRQDFVRDKVQSEITQKI